METWTTEQIEVIKRYNLISILRNSPFYGNDNNIRKANVSIELTDTEKEDIKSIKELYNGKENSLLKMLERYIVDGKNIVPYEYQNSIYDLMLQKKFLSLLASRQSGLSTLVSIFIFHSILVLENLEIIILSVNRDSGKNIIHRIKQLYLQTPFYAKPGVHAWNDASIKFDNNTTIRCEQPTKTLSLDSKKKTFLIVDQPMWMVDSKARIVKDNILETKLTNSENRAILLQNGLGGYNLLSDYFNDKDTIFHRVQYPFDKISSQLDDEFVNRVETLREHLGEQTYSREWLLKWISKN